MEPSTLQDGRYELLTRIGSGGFARVWRAIDTQASREVAVKRVPVAGQPEALGRALREARALEALDHPHVLPLLDWFHEGGHLVLVSELCLGSLADWVAQHGPLPPAAVARTAHAIASGLDAAHRAGVVHRDVKPSNALVREDGTVCIADFGVAALRDEGDLITRTGALVGTLPFMAPEQRHGERVGTPADVYGLGATMAWLALGASPGDLHEPATANRLQRLPVALRDLILACGRYAPADRPAMAEVVDRLAASAEAPADQGPDLRAVVPLTTGRASTLPSLEPAHEPSASGRRRAFVLAAAALLLAAAVGGAFALREAPAPAASTVPSALDLPLCDEPRQYVEVKRIGPAEVQGAAGADLDRDGFVDAVFVHNLGEEMTIYWGREGAVLADPMHVETPSLIGAPAIGDFDEDGHVELLARLVGVDALGEWEFQGRTVHFEGTRPEPSGFRWPQLADWNGDGHLDLIVTGRQSDRCVSWREGDGRGDFAPRRCLAPRVTQARVAPGPDGPVLLTIAETDRHTLRAHAHQPGDRAASPRPLIRSGLAPHGPPMLFDISALDGDGIDTVVTWSGTGEFPARIDLATGRACSLGRGPNSRATNLYPVDMDRDGRLDWLHFATCERCDSNHLVHLAR